MLKRILCSDGSIFEVILYHINNFSSLINFWWREFDFKSFLGFCLSFFLSFHDFFVFLRNFCMFFRKIFALFWSQNFRILCIIFAKFLHYSHANEMRKWSKMVEKFLLLRHDFSFLLETLVWPGLENLLWSFPENSSWSWFWRFSYNTL